MASARMGILGCAEHEKLESELLEVRTRWQYLTRLRGLTRAEQAEWDRRERAAQAKLANHDLDHGCSR